MKTWIEDRAGMEEILGRAPVGRLGLADGGEPYVVPLNFAYSDGCIYIHTGLEGRKLEIMDKNPRVCFEVDELLEIVPNEQACLFTTHYRSVIAWGTARLLEGADEKMKALGLLLDKYGKDAKSDPIPEHALFVVSVHEIRIESMTGKANLPEGTPG